MKITIINGPNLNLLGTRQPDIYGAKTLDEILADLGKRFPDVEFTHFQSNVEGELIDQIQKSGSFSDGIILNAGGYSHTSVAIADAVASVKAPVVEVHISNIYSREEERHVSLLTKYSEGIIAGLGNHVYELALQYFIKKQKGI
jgi:3-dehydroquinate dehydratase-2